jgi:selenide,water dikinase
MALASGVTLEIDSSSVRFLTGAAGYAAAGAQPGGLRNNREFASSCVEQRDGIDAATEALLYDPQTSGGLLISMAAGDAAAFERAYPDAHVIGRVTERSAKPIRLT